MPRGREIRLYCWRGLRLDCGHVTREKEELHETQGTGKADGTGRTNRPNRTRKTGMSWGSQGARGLHPGLQSVFSSEKREAVEQMGVLFPVSGCGSRHDRDLSGDMAAVPDRLAATGEGIAGRPADERDRCGRGHPGVQRGELQHAAVSLPERHVADPVLRQTGLP